MVLWLKQNSITDKELQICRNEVRKDDEKNLEIIFIEIRSLSDKIDKVKDQIIALHTKN